MPFQADDVNVCNEMPTFEYPSNGEKKTTTLLNISIKSS